MQFETTLIKFRLRSQAFWVPLPYYSKPCHVLLLLPHNMQLCENSNFVLFPGQLDDRPDGNNWDGEEEAWRGHWCSQEFPPQQRQRKKKVFLDNPSFCFQQQVLDNLWEDQSNHRDPCWWDTSCSRADCCPIMLTQFAGAHQSWAEPGGPRREPQNLNPRENPSLRMITTVSRSHWVEQL